jgi:predicted cupin superfamily sugar epimerase
MNQAAKQLISALQLSPLPGEGGFFRQTWRGESGSAILFLITPENFSALHRIAQDEIWHFYSGDPVEHVQFEESARTLNVARLGSRVLLGERSQLVVERGVWQGARLAAPENDRESVHGFALLGCTVTPAWDERGFKLADRTALTRLYPEETARIAALTR